MATFVRALRAEPDAATMMRHKKTPAMLLTSADVIFKFDFRPLLSGALMLCQG